MAVTPFIRKEFAGAFSFAYDTLGPVPGQLAAATRLARIETAAMMAPARLISHEVAYAGRIAGSSVLRDLETVALATPRSTVVRAYEVGTAGLLRARSIVGDNIGIHHVAQAHPMEQLIPGYSRATGPTIALPTMEHLQIPNLRGPTNLTPREILANDIWNLRKFTNAPNASLQELIQLNKHMYPGAFRK